MNHSIIKPPTKWYFSQWCQRTCENWRNSEHRSTIRYSNVINLFSVVSITGDEPRRAWKREPRVSYQWRFLVNKNLHVLQKQARKLSPLKLETTNLFHQVKQKKNKTTAWVHRGCDGTGGGDTSSWRCATQSKQITQPSAVALGSFTSYDRKSKRRVEITDSQLVTNSTQDTTSQVENISSVFKL